MNKSNVFELLLVRHGETIWNKETRLQGGASDIELTDLGRQQAERAAEALRGEKLNVIVTSPLQRAFYTARAIAKYHALEVEITPDLKEIDAGKIDGLKGEEISKLHPDFFKQWITGYIERIPGGESLKELGDRAWRVVEDLKRRYPDGKSLIVSHTFVTSSIICRALGADLHMSRRLATSNGGISLLRFRSDYTALVYFNDSCHLR